MSDEWADRKAKKVGTRSWEDLRNWWQEYLPVIPAPGTPPAMPVGELQTVEIELAKVAKDNLLEYPGDIQGLRQGVLHEGVFLLHKAVHVLAAAQAHIQEGMCSWSVSSAYHGAYFAMTAIMRFVGLAIVESDNRSFLIDVWASPRVLKKGVLRESKTLLINTKRVEQRHMWLFFQRALEITTNTTTVWDAGCSAAIQAMDYKEFARHRNDIHYRTSIWPCPDLHACFVQPQFGIHHGSMSDGTCISMADPDFSILLGLVLLRMASRMLDELAQTSADLTAEANFVSSWMQQPQHLLYQTAYP